MRRIVTCGLWCCVAVLGQRPDHGRVAAAGSVQDASQAAVTRPFRVGTVLPSSCTVGQAFFKSDASPGRNLYLCTASDTWSEVQGGTSSATYFRERDYVPVQNQAGTMQLANGWSTPGTGGATRGGGGAAPHAYGWLNFPDGSAPIYAVLNTRMPSDWSGGDVTAELIWMRGSGTGSGAVFGVEAGCTRDGFDHGAPAYGTIQRRTLTIPPTVGTLQTESWSPLVLPACTPGAMLAIRVSRDPTDAEDNFTGDLRMVNFVLRVPVQ
mgnify:CR=1 FL=1